MKHRQNEYQVIENLIEKLPEFATHKILSTVNYKGKEYPIHSFSIGNQDKDAPVLGLFGGVHGLEKIGTHVVLSYLGYILEQLQWNTELQETFKNIRLVSIPIVNPVGLFHNKRANGNGVDLMRNAPVDSKDKVAFLVGGHRIGKVLPWYRGNKEQMELESQILCDFVEENLIPSKNAISIDFHSGFGLQDRLWYPYANSKKTFEAIDKVNNLENLFNNLIPHHIYQIEPQSDQYTTHGDLWDHLYNLKKEKNPDGNFIPWTLEMGSWLWLKKNPIQIFSPHGLFNPMKDHRFERAMRRHFLMIDFFLKATNNPKAWN